MQTRQSLVSIALFSILIFAGSFARAADAARPPNFVFLFADDVAYDDVGCYGAMRIKTPNIDQLAKDGRKFTSFYAPSPVCTPSRAALMTGCYAPRVGLPAVLYPQANIGLNPDEITLPEVLKTRGYTTACIGKWHLGHLPPFMPNEHGFDYFYGIPYPNDHGPERSKRNNPPIPLYRNTEIIQQPVDLPNLNDHFIEEAKKFLNENKDKPFFLYLPFVDAHTPWYVAKRFEDKSDLGPYGDAVQEMDWGIGEVMKTLKELKLDDNTLVIFVSDNGPLFKPHAELEKLYGPAGTLLPQKHLLRDGKYSTAEGGVRVPMIARWPGKIAAGTESAEIGANFDWLPTFAKLAGAEVPTDRIIDGKDIWPLLAEDGAKSPHECFYYFANYTLEGVRVGNWKLRLLPHEIPEDGGKRVSGISLYDLDKDISETTDLSAEHPEIVARLQKYIDECRADIGDGAKKPGKNRREPGKVGDDAPHPG